MKPAVGALAAIAAVLLTSCTTPTPAAGAAEGPAAPVADQVPAQQRSYDSIARDDAAWALLPEATRQSGAITVVVSAASPPGSFISPDGGGPAGIFPEIALALGRVLGVEVTLAQIPFDGVIPGLQAGRYDMAVASMSGTAERLEVLDMVKFTLGGSAIAVPSGNPLGLDSRSLCDHRVGVVVGTHQATSRLPRLDEQTCGATGRPPIQAVSFPDSNALLLALSSNRIDAAMNDGPVLGYAQRQQGGRFDVLADDSQLKSIGGIGLPKGSPLVPAVEAAVRTLQGLPEYRDVYQRWGAVEFALPVEMAGRMTPADFS
ncbi:transporter substrate-binding domain-containing protein [Pseudonocardia humida]|uniref:Transporter substrate-binding domain-containing protein n=1 Tax=Pseudonocardia humida TaxID=2800819 RepID=A0ABT1A9Z3_9PSEU|nr:transporter substrate-binding domain-containing protein [Pseudonocardia humida]MCO1659763.1 transporter substrate-binding domain-containing protein [Pseudonocardia humida]